MKDNLTVRNIKKNYKNFKLEDISFSIKNEEVLGIVGANGAGKTTILKIIVGLIRNFDGEIIFYGNQDGKKQNKRLEIAYIPDTIPLPDHYTPKFAARIFKSAYKTWDEDKFELYLKKYNLEINKKVGEMSKGMKTKLLLALVLSYSPQILIMDEATEGLDPLTRYDFLDEIKRLKKEGMSIIFSSHVIADIEKIADKLVILNNGKISYYGNVETLKSENQIDCIEKTILKMMEIKNEMADII